MARIRSIKPEFFDNERLCALSPWHRLCFAGLWTQADKAGRMEDRPARLKARIFPYDDLDMEQLLADLAVQSFIVRYVVDGKHYLAIPEESWAEHQRPRPDEHESLLPPITYASVQNPSLHSDETVPSVGESDTHKSVGNREKGVGNREVGGTSPRTPSAQGLADLWNQETTHPIPHCRDLTLKRKQKIAIRLRERTLEEWQDVFRRIQASSFCRGQSDHGTWVASFDWIIASQDNAVKVLEGKYDDRQPVVKAPRTATIIPHRDRVDWREECDRLHGGTCGHREAHAVAMQRKAATA